MSKIAIDFFQLSKILIVYISEYHNPTSGNHLSWHSTLWWTSVFFLSLQYQMGLHPQVSSRMKRLHLNWRPQCPVGWHWGHAVDTANAAGAHLYARRRNTLVQTFALMSIFFTQAVTTSSRPESEHYFYPHCQTVLTFRVVYLIVYLHSNKWAHTGDVSLM